MSTKPLVKPEWATGGGAAVIEPGAVKKGLGWIVEKPPHQFFNWLHKLTYDWIFYFEEKTDELQAQVDGVDGDLAAEIVARIADVDAEEAARIAAVSAEATTRGTADTLLTNRIALAYDGIVGAGAGCTYATIAAAITALSAGARILVADSFALTASVALSKADMEIILKPGVVLSQSGGATSAFTTTASGIKIRGGKISGFASGILVSPGSTDLMVRDVRFASNTEDVTDAGELASVLGCI